MTPRVYGVCRTDRIRLEEAAYRGENLDHEHEHEQALVINIWGLAYFLGGLF